MTDRSELRIETNGPLGRDTRVYVGKEDISDIVAGVQFNANVDSMNTVEITFIYGVGAEISIPMGEHDEKTLLGVANEMRESKVADKDPVVIFDTALSKEASNKS